MKVFNKIRNAEGEVIEIPQGDELRQEAIKFADERGEKTKAENLQTGNSSFYVKRYITEGLGLDWDDIRNSMTAEVRTAKIGTLFTNDQTKPLFTSMIEDYVRGAYEKASKVNELIMGTVPMDQMTSSFYTALEDTEDLDFRDVAQGAPIPVMTIGVAENKIIQVYKRGGGFELTDEAKSMRIDQIANFLRLRGARIAKTDERLAIDTLLNGYFKDGWDAITKIGVKNTGKAALSDMWYASQYMAEKTMFTPKRAIMNLETSEKWVNNETTNGTPVFLENLLNGSTPNVVQTTPYISDQIPTDQILFVDTDFALQEYVFKALSTEVERQANRQIEGAYTTKTAGYVPFEPKARLLVDLNQSRA